MTAARKLAWVEAKLFLRDPLTAVFAFAYPLIVLFVLAEVFGTQPEYDDETGQPLFRGVPPVDYYVPAYIALVVASLGLISLPVQLATYRERGVLRRFRASGVPAWAVLAAQAAVLQGLAAASSAVLAVAAKLVYGVALPASWAATLAVLVLVGLEFAGIGALLGSALRTVRAAQGAGLILFFAMMFVSGAGPPPEVLSGPLKAVAGVLPLTHAIRALQDVWLGLPFQWGSAAAVAGFTVVPAALALALARR